MIRKIYTLLIAAFCLTLIGCNNSRETSTSVRHMVDTIGFAHYAWQVDSVMNRINRLQSSKLKKATPNNDKPWRVAICPHDDHTYVGWQYPAVLGNIKAKTVIIFGVAHKARYFNISNKIVFDSYKYWHAPYGNIKISKLREEIMKGLPDSTYMVSDTLQQFEHSVEGLLPFLQYFNRDVEIVSILVSSMNFDRMNEIAKPLAESVAKAMNNHELVWGKDIAIVLSNDAVHYGDEEWSGKNLAPFGADTTGYKRAVAHEHGIIDSCLLGLLGSERVKLFIRNTVLPNDYKEYKWTWCGRYSIPFGLLTSLNLQEQLKVEPLIGQFVGYSTSIDHEPLPVEDLRLGRTAMASIRHWVGYASVGYK
jgi:MEMO1 family protein